DTLPASDPRAEQARRDLRRVNTLMGNARHIAAALRPHWREGMRVADLGAGDGSLMRAVVRHLPGPIEAISVDKSQGIDVLDYLRQPGKLDAIVCNLFLHHLDADVLSDVLALAAERAPLFVACEPRRARIALQASRLLWVLGCNEVTRHDAVVSVRAGFTGNELSSAWPPGDWQLEERVAWPFTHLFVAHES
ncbi:MAG TPA: hypothetical protein VFR83_01595, partial [Burkholderiales bacterium]|nr:hypothetical protein [Burkholderiales bacterium]